MSHYGRAAFYGNSFIGLFLSTNNRHTLFPIDSPEKFISDACERLKTKPLCVNILESNLSGIYSAMNGNGIILPGAIAESERKKIEKETGLAVYASKEKLNANGNNLCANDKGGVISPEINEKERKAMGECLGVELVPMSVAGFTVMGSVCVANNKGFLTHYAANDEELARMGDALKVKGMPGSVNLGSGCVGIGIVANDNGYFAGEKTSAFELGRVEEALGFLD